MVLRTIYGRDLRHAALLRPFHRSLNFLMIVASFRPNGCDVFIFIKKYSGSILTKLLWKTEVDEQGWVRASSTLALVGNYCLVGFGNGPVTYMVLLVLGPVTCMVRWFLNQLRAWYAGSWISYVHGALVLGPVTCMVRWFLDQLRAWCAGSWPSYVHGALVLGPVTCIVRWFLDQLRTWCAGSWRPVAKRFISFLDGCIVMANVDKNEEMANIWDENIKGVFLNHL